MTKEKEGPRDKAIERQIDENLRRVYGQLEQDEIPERFLNLLDKLRQQG